MRPVRWALVVSLVGNCVLGGVLFSATDRTVTVDGELLVPIIFDPTPRAAVTRRLIIVDDDGVSHPCVIPSVNFLVGAVDFGQQSARSLGQHARVRVQIRGSGTDARCLDIEVVRFGYVSTPK